MCTGDASRVSGAGVAADERESSRVTTQAMLTGKLARKPHAIRSGTTLDPNNYLPSLRASSIITLSRCQSFSDKCFESSSNRAEIAWVAEPSKNVFRTWRKADRLARSLSIQELLATIENVLEGQKAARSDLRKAVARG
jgi:hypothetical protein